MNFTRPVITYIINEYLSNNVSLFGNPYEVHPSIQALKEIEQRLITSENSESKEEASPSVSDFDVISCFLRYELTSQAKKAFIHTLDEYFKMVSSHDKSDLKIGHYYAPALLGLKYHENDYFNFVTPLLVDFILKNTKDYYVYGYFIPFLERIQISYPYYMELKENKSSDYLLPKDDAAFLKACKGIRTEWEAIMFERAYRFGLLSGDCLKQVIVILIKAELTIESYQEELVDICTRPSTEGVYFSLKQLYEQGLLNQAIFELFLQVCKIPSYPFSIINHASKSHYSLFAQLIITLNNINLLDVSLLQQSIQIHDDKSDFPPIEASIIYLANKRILDKALLEALLQVKSGHHFFNALNLLASEDLLNKESVLRICNSIEPYQLANALISLNDIKSLEQYDSVISNDDLALNLESKTCQFIRKEGLLLLERADLLTPSNKKAFLASTKAQNKRVNVMHFLEENKLLNQTTFDWIKDCHFIEVLANKLKKLDPSSKLSQEDLLNLMQSILKDEISQSIEGQYDYKALFRDAACLGMSLPGEQVTSRYNALEYNIREVNKQLKTISLTTLLNHRESLMALSRTVSKLDDTLAAIDKGKPIPGEWVEYQKMDDSDSERLSSDEGGESNTINDIVLYGNCMLSKESRYKDKRPSDGKEKKSSIFDDVGVFSCSAKGLTRRTIEPVSSPGMK